MFKIRNCYLKKHIVCFVLVSDLFCFSNYLILIYCEDNSTYEVVLFSRTSSLDGIMFACSVHYRKNKQKSWNLTDIFVSASSCRTGLFPDLYSICIFVILKSSSKECSKTLKKRVWRPCPIDCFIIKIPKQILFD